MFKSDTFRDLPCMAIYSESSNPFFKPATHASIKLAARPQSSGGTLASSPAQVTSALTPRSTPKLTPRSSSTIHAPQSTGKINAPVRVGGVSTKAPVHVGGVSANAPVRGGGVSANAPVHVGEVSAKAREPTLLVTRSLAATPTVSSTEHPSRFAPSTEHPSRFAPRPVVVGGPPSSVISRKEVIEPPAWADTLQKRREQLMIRPKTKCRGCS